MGDLSSVHSAVLLVVVLPLSRCLDGDSMMVNHCQYMTVVVVAALCFGCGVLLQGWQF